MDEHVISMEQSLDTCTRLSIEVTTKEAVLKTIQDFDTNVCVVQELKKSVMHYVVVKINGLTYNRAKACLCDDLIFSNLVFVTLYPKIIVCRQHDFIDVKVTIGEMPWLALKQLDLIWPQSDGLRHTGQLFLLFVAPLPSPFSPAWSADFTYLKVSN